LSLLVANKNIGQFSSTLTEKKIEEIKVLNQNQDSHTILNEETKKSISILYKADRANKLINLVNFFKFINYILK
jgi:hypothetical protein